MTLSKIEKCARLMGGGVLTTQNEIIDEIIYDRNTGLFKWVNVIGYRKSGWFPGTKNSHGYYHIKVKGKLYKAHRLAWLYIYGEWPDSEIDHVNGDKSDNRICNLRVATRIQNQMNVSIRSNNSSGYKGVTYLKHIKGDRKWLSYIKVNKKMVYLGYFECKHEAARLYNKAAYELFGEFALLNHIDQKELDDGRFVNFVAGSGLETKIRFRCVSDKNLIVNSLHEHISKIVNHHGSLSEASDYLGICSTYLSRLMSGEKTSPSNEVLLKLGLFNDPVYSIKPEIVALSKQIYDRQFGDKE